MKNEHKITFILYTISSVCFFISSILEFVSENKFSISNLGLGICFLCLAITYYKKYKEEKKKEDKYN